MSVTNLNGQALDDFLALAGAAAKDFRIKTADAVKNVDKLQKERAAAAADVRLAFFAADQRALDDLQPEVELLRQAAAIKAAAGETPDPVPDVPTLTTFAALLPGAPAPAPAPAVGNPAPAITADPAPTTTMPRVRDYHRADPRGWNWLQRGIALAFAVVAFVITRIYTDPVWDAWMEYDNGWRTLAKVLSSIGIVLIGFFIGGMFGGWVTKRLERNQPVTPTTPAVAPAAVPAPVPASVPVPAPAPASAVAPAGQHAA